MLPLVVTRYSLREQYVNLSADRHLLRGARPAGDQAVEQLRADPADGPLTRAGLAPGGEQAVRGTEKARRPRPGPLLYGTEWAPHPHCVHDHGGRAARAAALAGRARRWPGAGVRAIAQGVLRR